MIDQSLRGTGRTTKMLKEALELAGVEKEVLILADYKFCEIKPNIENNRDALIQAITDYYEWANTDISKWGK